MPNKALLIIDKRERVVLVNYSNNAKHTTPLFDKEPPVRLGIESGMPPARGIAMFYY